MYDNSFFEAIKAGAKASARETIPLVINLIRPQSVVDVGCGTGAWLAAFSEFGVSDILGIDGDYVDLDQLEFARDRFLARDISKPFRLQREFDLVVSLEVAEHLPESCADDFIESLTRLGPVIAFSAAIPDQGGTHHINEQWPDYWAAKFDAQGFLVFDCLRLQLWSNPNVEPWYAQNMLLFVDRNHASSLPSLADSKPQCCFRDLAVVHPRIYRRNIWRIADMELARELATAIPAGEHFVLIDQNQLVEATKPGGGLRAHTFPENNRGVYAGKPANDDDAICELHRLECAGYRYVAIAWPAFWWLEHYSEFARYIREQYKTTYENERVIIFERISEPLEELDIDLDRGDLSGTLDIVRPYTKVGLGSLCDLGRHVRAVLANDIPGNFVECGVWRGGASFLMADLLRQAGVGDRSVWLFDSFEGLPPPAKIDGAAAREWSEQTDGAWYFDNCRESLDQVQSIARELGLFSYTRFVNGWFEETLPANRVELGKIAILRIDCDWYASVKCCLENLYDQVADGGVVILDDYYTRDGCAVAVHEFLAHRQLSHRIETVLGRSGRKPESAVIRKQNRPLCRNGK